MNPLPHRNRNARIITGLIRLICSTHLTVCFAHAYGTESTTIKSYDGTVNYQDTTITFGEPAEYCVLGAELNPDVGQWMFRYNLSIQESHHFKNGDIFVTFSHPNLPSELWFSGGEIPDAPTYAPATWYEYKQQGPVAYFSGRLNPITLVNVISRPTDLSSLSGGRVRISYGIRETEHSTITDSYDEMTVNASSRSIIIPVETFSTRGVFQQFCFIVTGVKKLTKCRSDCLLEIHNQ